MAETITVNYGWTKPDPGASANTWGQTLNSTTDKIDAQMLSASQGGVPIGTVAMFGGPAAPTNWLLCSGQSLSTAAPFDKLFAAIGHTYGGSGANFNLPDLRGVFPRGAGPTNGPGSKGGALNVTITGSQMPSHAHQITDVAHNHALNQNPHSHGDPGHTHGVNDPSHFHAGVVTPGGQFSLGVAGGTGLGPAGQTDARLTGVTIQASGSGLQPASANISLSPSGTGLSATQAAGGSLPLDVTPPYLTLAFIMKYA